MFLPKRSKPTPKVMTSPTMTSFFTRFAGMPRSMTSLSMGVTFLRSSGSMRWMGLRPTTPRSGSKEFDACASTRMPGRMAASTPPTDDTDRKPSSEMYVTMRPISSMWADSMSDGATPVPDRRAWTEPMTSVWISSAVPARRSRTSSATAISVPVADGVSSSCLRNFTRLFFINAPCSGRGRAQARRVRSVWEPV